MDFTPRMRNKYNSINALKLVNVKNIKQTQYQI